MTNEDFYFFANAAKPEEQGSFCDTASDIHYNSESKEEMLNNEAAHSERTGNRGDIRGDEDAETYNTTILEVDRFGSESPARHAPGR